MQLVLTRMYPSLTAFPRQPLTLGHKATQGNNNNNNSRNNSSNNSSSSSSSSKDLRGSSNNNNNNSSHKGSTLDFDPLLALGRAILVTG